MLSASFFRSLCFQVTSACPLWVWSFLYMWCVNPRVFFWNLMTQDWLTVPDWGLFSGIEMSLSRDEISRLQSVVFEVSSPGIHYEQMTEISYFCDIHLKILTRVWLITSYQDISEFYKISGTFILITFTMHYNLRRFIITYLTVLPI